MPVVSPDGRLVAAVRFAAGGAVVRIVALTGTDRPRLFKLDVRRRVRPVVDLHWAGQGWLVAIARRSWYPGRRELVATEQGDRLFTINVRRGRLMHRRRWPAGASRGDDSGLITYAARRFARIELPSGRTHVTSSSLVSPVLSDARRIPL
jgi:hypothetical protein